MLTFVSSFHELTNYYSSEFSDVSGSLQESLDETVMNEAMKSVSVDDLKMTIGMWKLVGKRC